MKLSRTSYLIIPFIISILFDSCSATIKSVLTYGKVSQLVTSSTLAWETFNNDEKQLEFAVQGGKYATEEEVCLTKIKLVSIVFKVSLF